MCVRTYSCTQFFFFLAQLRTNVNHYFLVRTLPRAKWVSIHQFNHQWLYMHTPNTQQIPLESESIYFLSCWQRFWAGFYNCNYVFNHNFTEIQLLLNIRFLNFRSVQLSLSIVEKIKVKGKLFPLKIKLETFCNN